MAKQKPITVDSSAIVVVDTLLPIIEKEGDKCIFNPKFEEGMAKFRELKNRVEEAEKQLKEFLSKVMDEAHTKKIEGDTVVAYKRIYGSKYEITDVEVAKAMGVVVEVPATWKPDSKEIERLLKDSGQLPDGIKLKDKDMQVTISDAK